MLFFFVNRAVANGVDGAALAAPLFRLANP